MTCGRLSLPLLRPRSGPVEGSGRSRVRTPRFQRPRAFVLAALIAGSAGLFAGQELSAQAQQPQRVVHTWKRIFYGSLDGEEGLLFADRLERGKPTFGDIDGDGDLDLLVGLADGRVMVFENGGSPAQPKWRLVNDALRALISSQEKPDGPGGEGPIDVGDSAAPALVDIDGDGDQDLFLGSASGRLMFFRNEGNPYLPQFAQISPNFLGASFGGNLVPRFADVNVDGAWDLLLGNERGEVFLIMNQGTRFAPSYCLNAAAPVPSCPAPPEPLVKLNAADNAAPDMVDWDADGDLDLMVGKSDGRIAFYRNLGTKTAPAWELAEERFNILDVGGYAAPVFRDFTGDGKPDLVLWGEGELVQFYRNQSGQGPFPLFLEDRNLLKVKRMGRSDRRLQLAAGDLNGDGLPDLIVGTGTGALYSYFAASKGEPIAFRGVAEPILPNPKRSLAAPALADIDGDGDLDLVVGDRSGRLELIRNAGTPKAPSWRSEEVFFGRVDVGSLSTPNFYDVDGDGDLDLLVGNSLGNVVLFENRGDKARPDLTLLSVRFGNLRLPGNAAPAVFLWNPKGPPDLVSGAADGSLYSAARNQAVPVNAGTGWLPEPQAWGGIQVTGYSAPQFADFSGDGKPDLLVGTGEGALALWRYEGSISLDQLARRDRPSGRNIVPDGGAGGFVLEDGASAPAGTTPNDLEARAGMRILQPRELPVDPIFVEEQNALTALSLGRNTFPVLADLNGDGLPDLLVGNAQGQLFYFRNRGPRVSPAWERVTERFADYDGGRNAAPALVDMDGDGDLDLVVGAETGLARYWENLGPRDQPKYRLKPDALRAVQVGNNAASAFLDLDADGRAELLVGNLKGSIYSYRRKSAALDYELLDRRFAGLNAGISAVPLFADLNNDKIPELLVGSDLGKIYLFQRTATSPFYSSGWKRNDAYFEGLKFLPGSHPAVTDLDGDGDADLLIGSDKGTLRFFRNNALVPEGASGAAQQR